MMSGMGQTVTVTPDAEKDRHGDPIGDTGAPFQVNDVLIAWGDQTRDSTLGDEQTSWVTLYMPAGIVVPITSHITLPDGDTYRVDGKPAVWQFGSWQPGVVVKCKRVVGGAVKSGLGVTR